MRTLRQAAWMVCPQGSTVICFVESNRYSKHTGQFCGGNAGGSGQHWRDAHWTVTWIGTKGSDSSQAADAMELD